MGKKVWIVWDTINDEQFLDKQLLLKDDDFFTWGYVSFWTKELCQQYIVVKLYDHTGLEPRQASLAVSDG